MYVFAMRTLKTANDAVRLINSDEEYARTFADINTDWIYFFVDLEAPEAL